MPSRARAPSSRAVLPWLIAVAALPACTALSVVDPAPIAAASSRDRTDSAIRDGLRREGWEIETWKSGEVYARTSIDDLKVRVRVVSDAIETRIAWIDIPSPLGSTPAEVADRKKSVRRALRSLSDRIEYLIESADLSTE
jgi:hypothetical protein